MGRNIWREVKPQCSCNLCTAGESIGTFVSVDRIQQIDGGRYVASDIWCVLPVYFKSDKQGTPLEV